VLVRIVVGDGGDRAVDVEPDLFCHRNGSPLVPVVTASLS
jgi:hypothetical protein